MSDINKITNLKKNHKSQLKKKSTESHKRVTENEQIGQTFNFKQRTKYEIKKEKRPHRTSLQSSFVQLVLLRRSNHRTVPSSPHDRKV